MTNTLPRFVQFSDISQAELITRHQSHVIICLGKGEVCNPFLVETNVPTNNNVILSLWKWRFTCNQAIVGKCCCKVLIDGRI